MANKVVKATSKKNKVVKSNENKNLSSVCEKSMEIFINIIKVSSLSLATMSLRTSSAPMTRVWANHEPTVINLSMSQGSVDAASVLAQDPGRFMSKEPERKLKLPSYLVEDRSRLITKKPQSKMSIPPSLVDENIDNAALNFIRRFHEKNRKLSKVSSRDINLPS